MVAMPSLPARPVRPTRLRYSLGSAGKSNKITWSTWALLKSMPLEALSVEMRMAGFVSRGRLNSIKLASRVAASTAPWYECTDLILSLRSSRCRMFSTRLHWSMVLQKTTVLCASALSSALSNAALLFSSTWSRERACSLGPEQSTRNSCTFGAMRCRPGPERSITSGNSVFICSVTSSGRVAVVKTNWVEGEQAWPMGCRGKDSSISNTSASSSTITFSSLRSISLRSTSCSRRPGVATSTSVPRRSFFLSASRSDPLVKQAVRNLSALARVFTTLDTCTASSVVGVSTTIKGDLASSLLWALLRSARAATRRCREGRRYARVFPEPVWSARMHGLPELIPKKERACIFEGWDISSEARTSTIWGVSPRAWKVFWE
mmetsp:Transcript_614/g.1309  ORF Transcript_614/g.1309 Transcript_614/m.1309 type:complete len:377 (-) Transcript_614:344-1474(-)